MCVREWECLRLGRKSTLCVSFLLFFKHRKFRIWSKFPSTLSLDFTLVWKDVFFCQNTTHFFSFFLSLSPSFPVSSRASLLCPFKIWSEEKIYVFYVCMLLFWFDFYFYWKWKKEKKPRGGKNGREGGRERGKKRNGDTNTQWTREL